MLELHIAFGDPPPAVWAQAPSPCMPQIALSSVLVPIK